MALATLKIPGINWTGIRDPATRELAVRVDGAWMDALKTGDPAMWWTNLTMMVPTDPATESTRLVLDLEDLGEYHEDNGSSSADEPPPLHSVLVPRKPWKKERSIRSRDLKMNNFLDYPDKLSGMLMASRRMPGAIVRELFTHSYTDLLTYQGIPLIGSGHYIDPNDTALGTFGNLHTGSAFGITNWRAAKKTVRKRRGPGNYPLDLKINIVLGGTDMEEHFDKVFKRTIILDETGAAGVTNINSSSFEEGVIPVITPHLDEHPWLVENPGKHQWWTISTTYRARPFGVLAENMGAPTVNVLDIGSEHEIKHESIYIVSRMAMNGCAGFPQTIDEWRE